MTLVGFKGIEENELTVRTVETNRSQVTITFDEYVPKAALPQIRFDAAVGILRKLLSHPQEEDREALAVKHATQLDLACGGPSSPSEQVYAHAINKLVRLNLCTLCGTHGVISKPRPSKRHKRKALCHHCGSSEKGWVLL